MIQIFAYFLLFLVFRTLSGVMMLLEPIQQVLGKEVLLQGHTLLSIFGPEFPEKTPKEPSWVLDSCCEPRVPTTAPSCRPHFAS